MTIAGPRALFWTLVLITSVAVSCRGSESSRVVPTPTPVVRAGELYTCGNGVDGCRVTYEIGPVRRVGETLRIEFLVTLDGPGGGTTEWTNDSTYHDVLKERGERGIVLTLSTDSSISYELSGVGGIAADDLTLVAPVTHWGYWEFSVPEPPGSVLLLSYPDFVDRPATIIVPE